MGRSKLPVADQLLSEIKGAVEKDVFFCPISESVFLELLKQQDIKTRHATAELIDEFSHGVTLVPYQQRVAQEIIGVLTNFESDSTQYYEPQDLIWSKVGYVLGAVHPVSTSPTQNDELAIQKAFFDHMWQIPLIEMVPLLEKGKILSSDPFVGTANRLNDLNSQNQSEVRKFKQVYLDEFRGALRLFMHIPRKWLEERYARCSGKTKYTLTNQEKFDLEKKFHAFFGNLITDNRAPLLLPSLHVVSMCHAAFRWDKGRRLFANDFYDFQHAAAAIGYCDAFLTERPLMTLLKQKHLGLETDFPCKVMADANEAVAWIKARVGEP